MTSSSFRVKGRPDVPSEIPAHPEIQDRAAPDAHPASAISFTPVSPVTSTDLQAALAEIINTIVPPGVVFSTASSTAPAGFLMLDGSTITNGQTLYPNLWAVIPAAWQSGADIVLPDAQGRTIVGAGAGAGLTARTLGDTFGEEEHLLTGAESGTSAHNHTQNSHNHTQNSHNHGSTGTVSSDHTHSFTTGTESSNHTHGPGAGADYFAYIQSAPSTTFFGQGGTLAAYATYSATTSIESANHTHSGSTGGISANHSHSTADATATNQAATATNNATAAADASVAHNNVQPSIALNLIVKT